MHGADPDEPSRRCESLPIRHFRIKSQPSIGLIFAGALPLVALRRELMLFDVAAVALVPPEEDRARDEDGGESTGNNTNDEYEREIIDHPCAEDVKRQCSEQSRDTGQQGTRDSACRGSAGR